MQRQHTHLTGLLGAILLTSGLASSISLGDETPIASEQAQGGDEGVSSSPTADAVPETSAAPEMVEVRISLPSGKTIVRMEPVRATSARFDMDFQVNSSRTLSDGSRISVAGRGVSGGSNSSSVRIGASSSGGGGGGGGGSSAHGGGGGGGGSSSGVASYTKPTLTAKGLDTDGVIEGARLQEGIGETASTPQSGSSSSGSSNSGSHAGVYQVTNNTSNYAVQGSGGSNSSGSTDSSSGPNPGSNAASPSIPTVGAADYDDEGATGGQRVEFGSAGMSAAVIGNMVYFNGVEFVQADQPFAVVTGTRVGTDSVIMDDERPSNAGAHDLSIFTTNSCPIRIEFDSDTVVNLLMQSQSSNPASPSRVERTWTMRVR